MKLEGNRVDNQKAVFSEVASHCFPFFFNKQWRDKKKIPLESQEKDRIVHSCDLLAQPATSLSQAGGDECGSPDLGGHLGHSLPKGETMGFR